MSHGGGEGGDNEPNLTPLLDLVLQLVMFFMINANFVMEQVSKDVELPSASMARPQESKERESGPVFLNIVPTEKVPKAAESSGDETGKPAVTSMVLVTGQNPMKPAQLQTYLKTRMADAQRTAGKKDVDTVVIIRADKNVRYKDVFQVLSVCKSVGFKNVQLRALRGG
jgi:biopolymer transport protein ExbD